MFDKEFEKRFLKQHNIVSAPSTSAPILSASPKLPTTPTKNNCTGDRFIPVRSPEKWELHTSPPKLKSSESPSARRDLNSVRQRQPGRAEIDPQRPESVAYKALLKNELLQYRIEDVRAEQQEDYFPSISNSAGNLFKFQVQRSPTKQENYSPYSMSPISPHSQKLLRSPRMAVRKIQKVPSKVLDAPELQDDFYLNLVDWSSQNVLSVGLGNSVYLWSARTSQVINLCSLAGENDTVTSVGWSDKGNHLAVGTQQGLCQIWDIETKKQIHNLDGHTRRIGCVTWNGDLVTTGSRDYSILQRDIRAAPTDYKKLSFHTQEVCGLKWSPDRQYLASGGNDNRLLVWALGSTTTPVQVYAEHQAAVKAIAWSPHHHGLLASGGGTADRHIRFWNTLTGQAMQKVDTGSQVCNIAWSKHSSEIVSTHGYSQNQIIVWKYPSMQQMAKLTGHSYRVLYLAMSPDGESIVTGAGDETLRFWNVFCKPRQQKEKKSALNLFTSIR